MATTARGIVYPTVGTTLTPLANHFASLATSTNTAIDNVVNGAAAFKGLDAAKGAAGQEGRTYYATDTNRLWFDDGTNWVSAEQGAYLITPTSVINATIGTNGRVTFSGASTVSLNGVFTSRFVEYEIAFDVVKSSTTAIALMRLRAAGADASAANYNYRRTGTSGAGYVEATNVSVDRFEFAVSGLTTQTVRVRVRDANAAAFTRLTEGVSYDTNGASIAQTSSVVGEHRLSTAYDGFTIYPSAGTVTGNVRVLGYL